MDVSLRLKGAAPTGAVSASRRVLTPSTSRRIRPSCRSARRCPLRRLLTACLAARLLFWPVTEYEMSSGNPPMACLSFARRSALHSVCRIRDRVTMALSLDWTMLRLICPSCWRRYRPIISIQGTRRTIVGRVEQRDGRAHSQCFAANICQVWGAENRGGSYHRST